MPKLFVRPLVIALLFALSALSAHAQTANGNLQSIRNSFGLPSISFNSNGVTNYNAQTGELKVTATPLEMLVSKAPFKLLTFQAPRSLSLSMILDQDGNLVSADPGFFELTGKVVDPDTGDVVYDGLLLSGTLLEFRYLDSGDPSPSNSDELEFRLKVVGGHLAPFYAGMDIGISLFPFERSTFEGSFRQNWHGGAKGNIAPIPPDPDICRGSIGDLVWHDVNGNGVQDPDEPGLNNATIRLEGGPDNLDVAMDSMAYPGFGNGFYTFARLCPGTYTVSVTNPPPGNFTATIVNVPSGTTADDSNPNPSGVTLTVQAGDDITIDFGYVSKPCGAELGDFVWIDKNANGIQDDGEPAVPNVRVDLLDGNGQTFEPAVYTMTDADGRYRFTGLCPNYYVVQFTAPKGFAFTLPNQGDRETDSDANPLTGRTAQITLLDGVKDYSWDAGLKDGCPPPPPCLTCPVTTGKVGQEYSSKLRVQGGEAPYTFSIVSGALPPGLTLDSTTGAIVGTPTTLGTYSFTVQVVDANGVVDTVKCAIAISGSSYCSWKDWGHKDDNRDRKCDYHGKPFESQYCSRTWGHKDDNRDGKCDHHGKYLEASTSCPREWGHRDDNRDGKCDYHGKRFESSRSCSKSWGHKDDNHDGKCDYHGKRVSWSR